MNTAAKGRRNEHRSIALYEAQGFSCIRAAASKGAWDFAAFSGHNVVLVQVKSSRWPGRRERAQLAAFKAPASVIRELHRWRPRARRPDVMVWVGGEWRLQA
jgi:hypothetical protein